MKSLIPLIQIFLLIVATISLIPPLLEEDTNTAMADLPTSPWRDNSLEPTNGKILVYPSFEAREHGIKELKAQGAVIIQEYSFFPAVFTHFTEPTRFLKQEPLEIYENKEFQIFPKEIDYWKYTKSSKFPEGYDWTETINVAPLWAKDLDGTDIKLGILDTGISSSHQDLNVEYSESFTGREYDYTIDDIEGDFNGHGTHVAGIAAGSGSSSNGEYRGVAPGVRLYDLKCVNYVGMGTIAAVLAAIDKAVELNLDIISLSLGWDILQQNNPINLAVNMAVENGVTVVASAGNDGPNYYTVSSPGNAQRAITVGASTINKSLNSFSSRGPTLDNRVVPDILAPGSKIISCLSENSLVNLAYQSLSPAPILSGNLPNSNYVAFSGTSMATPAVAGTIALLKQAYQDATPDALRAAIVESANTINEPELAEGGGILDAEAAWELLGATKQSGTYEITSILPKDNLLIFEEPIFAGENRTTDLIIVKGHTSDLSLSLESGNISSFVHISNTSISDAQGYTQIEITIQTPLFIEPGTYVGTLNITDSKTGTQTIDIGPIIITTPRVRVYWDLFHSDSADSFMGNYFDLFQYLENLNIQIVEYDSPITDLELLGNSYQVLVLPDAEFQYSKQEREIITEFIRSGGGVLVLSEYYPFSVNEAYNDIISPFGISFNTEPVSTEDYGVFESIDFEPTPLILTSHNELFLDVTEITWYGGSTLTSTTNIAFLEGSTEGVMATYEGNTTYSGRILAIGEELPFYNSRFSTADHKQFATNIFHWLAQRPQNGLSLQTLSQEKIYEPNQVAEFTIQVNNGSNPLNTDLSSQIELNLTFANGTFQTGLHPTVESINGGLYDFTFELPSEMGLFLLEAELNGVIASSWILSTTFSTNITAISASTTSSVTEVPLWAENADFFVKRAGNDQINFQVTVNDSFIDNCSLYLTSVPEITFLASRNIPEVMIYYHVLPLSYNGENWTGAWNPSDDAPAGIYYFYIQVTNNSAPIEGLITGTLFINGETPRIDPEESQIAGKALSQYDISEYGNQGILILNLGQTVNITISGSDDSNNEDLECSYLFIPYYLFLEMDIWFEHKLMEFTSEGTWTTTFTAPITTTYPYSSTIDIPLTENYLALLIVLKDPDGFVEIYWPPVLIVLNIDLFSFLDPTLFIYLAIIVIIIGIVAVGGFYLFTRRSSRIKKYPYLDPNYIPEIPPSKIPPAIEHAQPKFCGYCGKPLLKNEKFCGSCGAKIRE
ncbi:MAG: S8 family serine peptidase [Candidatus Hermodarchaeota archaeon]